MTNPNYTNALNKLVTTDEINVEVDKLVTKGDTWSSPSQQHLQKGDTSRNAGSTVREILKLWAALTVIALVILTCIYSLLIEISEPGTTGRALKVVVVTGWEWLLH
jgi:hypothetical protein